MEVGMNTKAEPTEVTKRLQESTGIGVQQGGSVVPRIQITQIYVGFTVAQVWVELYVLGSYGGTRCTLFGIMVFGWIVCK